MIGAAVLASTTPASPSLPVGPPAPTFQGNTAHTGASTERFAPPLRMRWARTLPGKVFFPVIAQGRVFVVSNERALMRLDAFDLNTGRRLWFRTLSGGGLSTVGYGSGRLFAVTQNCTVLSLDPATGGTRWVAKDFAIEYNCTAPPVVRNGVVFVISGAARGALTARNATTGRFLWRRASGTAQFDPPTVTADRVYSIGLIDVRAFTFDGTRLWAAACCGYPPGGGTAAFYRGRLYVRYGAGVLDATSGTLVGQLASDTALAFAGNRALRITSGDLQAVNLDTGDTEWTYSATADIEVPPLVVGGFAYIGSRSGELTAVRIEDGQAIWTTQAPAAISGSEVTHEHVGFAAANGILAVPVEQQLVVYEPTP